MKEYIKNRVHELYWNDDINCARTVMDLSGWQASLKDRENTGSESCRKKQNLFRTFSSHFFFWLLSL